MNVGDLRIDPVIDATGRFEPTKSFRGTTPEMWSIHRDLLDEDGLLGFSMGGFLIRGGGHVTLVDLGMGPKTWLGLTGGSFLSELVGLGVQPQDVTDVVFTHLHFDHIGWASDDNGRPVFPKATYRCAPADWDHFLGDHPDEQATEILAPIKDRFATWEKPGPILPGIDAQSAPGHTPGSAVIVISSGSERAMLLGDVAHCAVELVDDEWEGISDVDPVLAAKTRAALSRELEGRAIPAAAAHFPGLQFGRLIQAEGRRRWVV